MEQVERSGQAPAMPAVADDILSAEAPRAAAFIVTVYGDVVEPRGGTLWMGTLIEVCSAHGISESLVRTAVSRLVASGRLLGERGGRRSFYRLTSAARREFAAAARILFAPPPPAAGWLLWADAADELPRDPWARIGPGLALAPDRADLDPPDGLLMRVETLKGAAVLPEFAARYWELDGIANSYRAVIDRFAPLAEALSGGYGPDGAAALALRLRLVDQYRAVALRDPRLPSAALPADWPGRQCRALFVTLYRTLAPASDIYIGRHFQDADGLLLASTEGTALRLERLEREEYHPTY